MPVQLELRHNLPFVTVRISHRGDELEVDSVLVDTGSASTILSADAVAEVGIVPRPEDRLRTLRGIGGTETVYTRVIDRLAVGGVSLDDFEVEIGGMDYGFEIQGIIGMDFLLRTSALLDLGRQELRFEK